MSEGVKELPEGFRYANELPDKDRWEPLPPEAYEKPRRNHRTIDEADLARVNTLREALRRFRAKKPGAKKTIDINFKGARVGALFEDGGEQYFVMFKREFYRHFSQHFPEVPQKGFAVITAKQIVNWAADKGILIAAIFPSGRCYSIDGYDFWLFYEEYKTEVKHLEDEIACPLEMWKRLF